jgi:bacterioferritin-associated ferredoxin
MQMIAQRKCSEPRSVAAQRLKSQRARRGAHCCRAHVAAHVLARPVKIQALYFLIVAESRMRIIRICARVRVSLCNQRVETCALATFCFSPNYARTNRMIVCICHGINDKTIRIAVANGASTPSDIACATGAGSCCGKCGDCVRDILNDELCTLTPLAA